MPSLQVDGVGVIVGADVGNFVGWPVGAGVGKEEGSAVGVRVGRGVLQTRPVQTSLSQSRPKKQLFPGLHP
jgi:outer membrane lipoprotein SlyB